MEKIRKDFREFRLLLQSIPVGVAALFVLSVFGMNLLANKSISLPFSWMALDGGIVISWATFLSMDVITRHFGPKAATQLSIFVVLLNLLFCLIFFIVSRIPGTWGESFVEGSEAVINCALDNTFGGTWYILAGSTVAFIVSSVVNNYLNAAVGALFKGKQQSYGAFAARAYISTAVGQFVDNLVFALLVSRVFFGWTLVQCFVCAATGMLAELLCEVLFSFWGYRISKRWEREKVGEKYLAMIGKKGTANV